MSDDEALEVHEAVRQANHNQQVRGAEDGALAVPDRVLNANFKQTILTAEAAQHDHPSQLAPVQVDRAAEAVHHFPHWDKLEKGIDKETMKDAVCETMNMHSPAKDPAAGQKYHKTEEMKSSTNEQKDSMSKEQLLNECFVLKRRINKLEDMTLKQQTEATRESRLALPNIRGKFPWWTTGQRRFRSTRMR
jgi:hypothetical protein